MSNKLRFALIALALTVFAVIAAHAITFGEPDGGAHPYVGTLLFVQNGAGYYSCTGTLLSPTVLLTAGHCVESYGRVNDATYVRFEEDALSGRSDYSTTQKWLDREWIEAKAVIPHPLYSDYSAFPNTYDVGLVILSKPVRLSQYGTLPTPFALDGVLAASGNSHNWFTAVGYGAQGVINPFEQDDYERYRALTRLVELNSTFNGDDQSAKFTNHPGNDTGGTCYGDSGGPLFYQDTNTVTAIVSFGYTPCIGVDYQFRIDTPLALDFITPYLSSKRPR